MAMGEVTGDGDGVMSAGTISRQSEASDSLSHTTTFLIISRFGTWVLWRRRLPITGL